MGVSHFGQSYGITLSLYTSRANPRRLEDSVSLRSVWLFLVAGLCALRVLRGELFCCCYLAPNAECLLPITQEAHGRQAGPLNGPFRLSHVRALRGESISNPDVHLDLQLKKTYL